MSIDTVVRLLKRRRTKIVATVGPSSSSPEVLDGLIDAGVDVFRMNFSHGDHPGHGETHARIRAAAENADSTVAILADLCGPKIRVGHFAGGGIDLERGSDVTVTVRDVEGEPGLIPSFYSDLAKDVGPGDRVLLADGVLELRVESVEGTEIRCTVIQGGRLTDRKGLNLPGVRVSAPSLTEKDKVDARYALELGVDFLALSFVRRATDVKQLRELMNEAGHEAGIIAKIERPEALDDFDGILDAADGVMVARGDLGVELPPEQVPVAQRFMIDAARRAAKPVIIATQMLESMVENARPTRAEVSDVSYAVSSGADAVMLSGETAAGAHPVTTVETMDRVARQTEGYQWSHGHFGSLVLEARVDIAADEVLPVGDAVARATAYLSRDLLVRGIVVPSTTGRSVQEAASARPAAPVVALSSNLDTCRKSRLLWGVLPVHLSEEAIADHKAAARSAVKKLGIAEDGHYILLVRGFSPDARLSMPSVGVLLV